MFTSTENKAFLWEFMYKEGIFSNLPDEYSAEVKRLLDAKMYGIETNARSSNLTDLNKQVITEMVKEVNYRKKDLNVDMEKKQSEFDNLINIKTPDKVDFSDKTDGPIENMDEMLNKMINKRALEVKTLVPKPPPSKNIKIEDKVANKEDVLNVRKISFSDNVEEFNIENHKQTQNQSNVKVLNTFLSNLKPTSLEQNIENTESTENTTKIDAYVQTTMENNESNIMGEIQEIKRIQMQILDILNARQSLPPQHYGLTTEIKKK